MPLEPLQKIKGWSESLLLGSLFCPTKLYADPYAATIFLNYVAS